MTKRREVLIALGAGALAAPFRSLAQQRNKIWRVGFLTGFSSIEDARVFESFRQGMRELGYEEGRNIAYDARWAEGKFERLPGLAAELIGLKPDVMFVSTIRCHSSSEYSSGRRRRPMPAFATRMLMVPS